MSGRRSDIERALVASAEPSAARLILFVLLVRADWGSGVIYDEYTPSLADIARESGLSKAAVATHLNGLEDRGWIKRSRSSGRVTTYTLHAVTCPGRGQVTCPGDGQVGPTSPGDGQAPVQEMDRSEQATVLPSSPIGNPPPTEGGVGGNQEPGGKQAAKAKTRLADGWWPDAGLVGWVRDHCKHLDDEAMTRHTLRFINWAVGEEKQYKSWRRTYQNWMLREDDSAAERKKRGASRAGSGRSVKHENYTQPDAYDDLKGEK